MGRPVNSRYFGKTVYQGQNLVEEENFNAIVKIGVNSVSNAGIVISQKSERRFVVNDAPDKTGNRGICELVDKEIPEDNEMVMVGVIDGTLDTVRIRKLHNRTVFDFNNNRYTWKIVDDAETNTLVLSKI